MKQHVGWIGVAVWLMHGCGSTPELRNTPEFQAGYTAGCATAKGNYTKDSERFNTERDYHEGWFEGRKRCNPSFHQE